MHAIDMVGKRFGQLTVLQRVESRDNSHQAWWECKCDCGNNIFVRGGQLRSGNTKSCGCYRNEEQYKNIAKYLNSEENAERLRKVAKRKHDQAIKNYVGKKFDKILILEEADEEHQKIHSGKPVLTFKCICDCGNVCYKSSNFIRDFKKGFGASCGCVKKQKCHDRFFVDLTDKKIGILTPKYYIKDEKSHNLKWHCICECGQECDVMANKLINQKQLSCGCISQSKGEAKICLLLDQLQLKYKRQAKFSDCKLDKNNLRFDFYVDNRYLIEYDGEQHFKPVDFFGGEDYFKQLKDSDEFKNKWAKEKGIPLIRIPFTILSTLNQDDILIDRSNYKIC